MFINENTLQYPYTDRQLRRDNPGVSFPMDMTDERRAEWGVKPVVTVVPPTPGPNQRIEEGQPEKVGGEWRQTWSVVDAPVEVPAEVTMRQARRALHAAGLLSQVEAAIAALPEPQKTAALIDWEYALGVRRTDATFAALAAALGLTEAQIDDLFIAAAQYQ